MTENTGKAKILIVEDEVSLAADMGILPERSGSIVCSQTTKGEKLPSVDEAQALRSGTTPGQ